MYVIIPVSEAVDRERLATAEARPDIGRHPEARVGFQGDLAGGAVVHDVAPFRRDGAQRVQQL